MPLSSPAACQACYEDAYRGYMIEQDELAKASRPKRIELAEPRLANSSKTER